jgi:hypothetical protein
VGWGACFGTWQETGMEKLEHSYFAFALSHEAWENHRLPQCLCERESAEHEVMVWQDNIKTVIKTCWGVTLARWQSRTP